MNSYEFWYYFVRTVVCELNGSTAYYSSFIGFRYFLKKSTIRSNNLLSVSANLRAVLLGLNRLLLRNMPVQEGWNVTNWKILCSPETRSGTKQKQILEGIFLLITQKSRHKHGNLRSTVIKPPQIPSEDYHRIVVEHNYCKRIITIRENEISLIVARLTDIIYLATAMWSHLWFTATWTKIT